MDPVGWIVGLAILFGGYDLISEDELKEQAAEAVQEQTIVSEAPVFERGRYFKSSDGYFISNLTLAPVKPDGCDSPILTADLTSPRINDGQIRVTEVTIVCGG